MVCMQQLYQFVNTICFLLEMNAIVPGFICAAGWSLSCYGTLN